MLCCDLRTYTCAYIMMHSEIWVADARLLRKCTDICTHSTRTRHSIMQRENDCARLRLHDIGRSAEQSSRKYSFTRPPLPLRSRSPNPQFILSQMIYGDAHARERNTSNWGRRVGGPMQICVYAFGAVYMLVARFACTRKTSGSVHTVAKGYAETQKLIRACDI